MKALKNTNIPNLLNQMASPQPDRVFLGLAQIDDHSDWGVTIEQRNYCAVFHHVKVSKKPFTDNEIEIDQVKKDLHHAIVMTGHKGPNFIKRFASKQDAINWYNKVLEINPSQDKGIIKEL